LSYNIGTKVPLLCVLISLAVAVVISLVNLILKRKGALKILLVSSLLMIFAVLYIPFSPIGKNLNMHLAIANVHTISDFFDDDNMANDETINNDETIVDDCSEFEASDNSTNVIYSSRNVYNAKIREVFVSSSFSTKIIGMGYLNAKLGVDLSFRSFITSFVEKVL
jgi:hypothetical protein